MSEENTKERRGERSTHTGEWKKRAATTSHLWLLCLLANSISFMVEFIASFPVTVRETTSQMSSPKMTRAGANASARVWSFKRSLLLGPWTQKPRQKLREEKICVECLVRLRGMVIALF